MARLKTASLGPSIVLARELMGDDRIKELVGGLSPQTQLLLSKSGGGAEWVDTEHWLPFPQALLDEHFEGDEVEFRSFVRKVAAREVGPLSKLLIRMLMSPERVMRHLSRRWAAFSDSGTFEVVGREKLEAGQRLSLKLSAFKSEQTVFGTMLHAFVEELVQATSARAAEVRCPVNRVVLGELETELVVEYG